jgi:chromosome segregation protein
MKLKRVRIFGFKTFADRTDLNVDGDIIAVVGPNGCGKSNLVDAILWGLGEGSARQLRAQTSQDVIFNGSALRKGVGYTEVQLTFDNEDGVLPVQSPEVSISRKLNRAGESEYTINRHPCRQRDIHELLADSGLGRAGYAIVSQREIDQALNASAEDRRAWIDEAAGVQRYRSRKTEALKRLASAQDHLTRVSEIVSELEIQREPLEQEAQQAIRYRSLQTSLKEVEVAYLVNEANAAQDEEQEMAAKADRAQSLSSKELSQIEKLSKDQKSDEEALENLTKKLASTQEQRQQRLMDLERTTSEILIAQQRLNNLEEKTQSLADDKAELEARIFEAVRDLDKAEADEQKDQEELAALEAMTGGASQESKLLAGQLNQAENKLNEAKKQEATRLKAEAEKAHWEERRLLTKRELAALEKNLPQLQQAVDRAQTDYNEALTERNQTQAKLKDLSTQEQQIKAEEDEDAKASRTSLSERALLEGRIKGIEATLDSNEGLAQGSRAVMEAAKAGLLPNAYTPVAAVIQVKKEFATAIETALGAAANDLIVDHSDHAKAAIQWLKDNRAGRATFQPIPLMRPVRSTPDLEKLTRDPEVVGIASRLIDFKEENRPVIESLLGRVVIVKTLDGGLKLAKTTGWSKLVTLDGEVVHQSGAVTGGHNLKPAYGMVQRKADLADLKKKLTEANTQIAGFDKRSQTRANQINKIKEQILDLDAELRAQEETTREADSYLRALSEELKTTLKEREKLVKELAAHPPTVPSPPNNLKQLEQERDQALQALAAKSADADSAKERLQESERRLLLAKERTQAAAQRLKQAQHAADTRNQKEDSIVPERQKIQNQISVLNIRKTTLQEESNQLGAELKSTEQTRTNLAEKIKTTVEKINESRKNLETLADAVHQSELGRTRAQSRRSAALIRLMDEYEILPEQAEAQRGKLTPPPDAPAIVQRLRREMRAMGDVNLGAIEAFERLTTRVEELSVQRDDVLGGIAEVEASIRELDRMTRDRFVITFDQVGAAFAEMFEKLFGGGEGRLLLTLPDDVLNSGIEIEVTLPGKRRQFLNLLSGGERALCTCAFLFALLKVKPSPLVILDEIDAPLDGRNVERFAETLLEFTERTQFIVITHNPVTIAAAPVWIGVSMEEPGVTRLLPVQAPTELATSPN